MRKLGLGLLVGAMLMLVPAVALADGGPYSDKTVNNQNGTPEEFSLGVSGSCPSNPPSFALIHRWYSGGHWSSWYSLGGCLIGEATISYGYGLDVGKNQDGRLEVFGIGTNHAVWHIWQTQASSGPWSSWAQRGAKSDFDTGVAVGSEFSGQPNMHAYAWTSFYTRWVTYQTSPGGAWSDWFQG